MIKKINSLLVLGLVTTISSLAHAGSISCDLSTSVKAKSTATNSYENEPLSRIHARALSGCADRLVQIIMDQCSAKQKLSRQLNLTEKDSLSVQLNASSLRDGADETFEFHGWIRIQRNGKFEVINVHGAMSMKGTSSKRFSKGQLDRADPNLYTLVDGSCNTSSEHAVTMFIDEDNGSRLIESRSSR